METRKLYYEDCHLAAFSATVTACREVPEGYAVELDATAFYPEGGGQACDVGILGDTVVLTVREEDERILHICREPLTPGQQVNGKIDYDRRFDLMQQHTGEHIVSGLVHSMFGYHNMGFHVGAECMEVDFDGVISQEKLIQLEQEANRAVWANLKVECFVPSREELPRTPYRTKRELPWPVRIVRIPGVDSCACCGVHTAYTGEVGLIKILSCVKFRQGVRLELACGQRAMRYVNRVWEQNRGVSQKLSAQMTETVQAVNRLCAQLSEEKLRCAQLQRQLFETISQTYENRGHAVCIQNDLNGGELRQLAEKIAARCGGTAVVLSQANDKLSLCVACPQGDASVLGKALCDAFAGKGGGRGGFFQGTLQANPEAVKTLAISFLS